MYLSYGSPVYITFNMAADGRVGYAGPDLNNTSDPNQDVLFEFAEFTVTGREYWGNTTRVDFFSFPMVTRLYGTGGFDNRPGDYPTYDKVVGDVGTRTDIFNSFKNNAPAAWKTLVDELWRLVKRPSMRDRHIPITLTITSMSSGINILHRIWYSVVKPVHLPEGYPETS